MSQGSVATCFRCGGILNYCVARNLLLSLLLKEFRKSVFGKVRDKNIVAPFSRHGVKLTVMQVSHQTTDFNSTSVVRQF